VWRRGSVIASWLLDLTAAALTKDAALSGFAGRVSDSGEGRWTIKAAIDEAVPVPVLTTALYERFTSRGEADFQDKLLSAMRFQFGGHVEKAAGSNGLLRHFSVASSTGRAGRRNSKNLRLIPEGGSKHYNFARFANSSAGGVRPG